MEFETKLITCKNELLQYQNDIAELFQSSFNAELDLELWRWAYIDNVCGSPVVSLYYHQNVLVGHYAVIPIKLILNGRDVLAGLSMTTMVDLNYRRHGIFVKQANEVYKKAKQLGFVLVYGFPNANSAPGFKKRLDWTIENQGYVIKIQGKDLNLKESNLENKIHFNYQDEEFLKWRLSKPKQRYIKKENLILKKFGSDYDMVFYGDSSFELEENLNYHLFVDDNGEYENKKVFDYTFGYKIFDENFIGFNFKKDLIMSDIF